MRVLALLLLLLSLVFKFVDANFLCSVSNGLKYSISSNNGDK
jgi:hypothetical protein